MIHSRSILELSTAKGREMRLCLLRLVVGLTIGAFCFARAVEVCADGRPNVLLIMADDMRPWLGAYGESGLRTPHLDRLADAGLVFERAYCQNAVCGPSRASLLTGLRPDTTRIFDNDTHFRTHNPSIVTLPQLFREHGYRTQAIGKIFHPSFAQAYVGARMDDLPSWSEPTWYPPPQYYHTGSGMALAESIFLRHPGCGMYQGATCMHNRLQEAAELTPAQRSLYGGGEWKRHFVQAALCEAPDVPDNELGDGQIADRAIEALQQMKGKPFFLAVGFLRPHVPFVAPKKYWDLYQREAFSPVRNGKAPANLSRATYPAMHDHGAYEGAPPEGPLDDDKARELMHGYAACVSFVDAQAGRVLEELKRLGLAENTIVVFLGDHGYHLGENGRWGKQTCYETATRAPLIVSAPGTKAAGKHTKALVEFVDLFPTLCELAALPAPERLEGSSFARLLDTPERPWKRATFSQFPDPVRVSRPEVLAAPGDLMGRTIRTDRYRLIVWEHVLDPAKVEEVELYDYVSDPGETTNIADDPAQAETLAAMMSILREGWRGSVPP
ncbi:MAG: sulfatase [Candidatus Hydrogenedentes bacterium]|nr:sulfatase [Candidatus Hydrogenedentota bacterium]